MINKNPNPAVHIRFHFVVSWKNVTAEIVERRKITGKSSVVTKYCGALTKATKKNAVSVPFDPLLR